MREIKFRAYWKGVNQMVYFDKLVLDWSKGGEVGMFIPAVDGSIYMGKSEVMQYTGLIDKNGKEIYEGDILLSRFKDKIPKFYIVEWDICNPCFVLKGTIKHNYGHEMEYDFVQCDLRKNEVVGNIYENPELLK